MLLHSLVIATAALTAPTLAAEQTAKSGSFKTASAFKGIEEAQQTGGHTLSHGVIYGIVTEDNPLHIKTANCPSSEISGDTASLGSCPSEWCNNGEAVVISGRAGSIKLPLRAA